MQKKRRMRKFIRPFFCILSAACNMDHSFGILYPIKIGY
jgi:hypothetical protein